MQRSIPRGPNPNMSFERHVRIKTILLAYSSGALLR
jgi:hypothetical protein